MSVVIGLLSGERERYVTELVELWGHKHVHIERPLLFLRDEGFGFKWFIQVDIQLLKSLYIPTGYLMITFSFAECNRALRK